jgi:hypothetical protein
MRRSDLEDDLAAERERRHALVADVRDYLGWLRLSSKRITGEAPDGTTEHFDDCPTTRTLRRALDRYYDFHADRLEVTILDAYDEDSIAD